MTAYIVLGIYAAVAIGSIGCSLVALRLASKRRLKEQSDHEVVVAPQVTAMASSAGKASIEELIRTEIVSQLRRLGLGMELHPMGVPREPTMPTSAGKVPDVLASLLQSERLTEESAGQVTYNFDRLLEIAIQANYRDMSFDEGVRRRHGSELLWRYFDERTPLDNLDSKSTDVRKPTTLKRAS